MTLISNLTTTLAFRGGYRWVGIPIMLVRPVLSRVREAFTDLVLCIAWEFAMIDAGLGSEGFYFNSSGLQWNETYEGFGGWLGECCPGILSIVEADIGSFSM